MAEAPLVNGASGALGIILHQFQPDIPRYPMPEGGWPGALWGEGCQLITPDMTPLSCEAPGTGC